MDSIELLAKQKGSKLTRKSDAKQGVMGLVGLGSSKLKTWYKKLGNDNGHAWEALHEECDWLLEVVCERLARLGTCVSPRVVVVQPV